MQKMQELLNQREQLMMLKQTLNNKASLQTSEGMMYARTLAKLALIELELEQMGKTALQSGLK